MNFKAAHISYTPIPEVGISNVMVFQYLYPEEYIYPE